MRNDAVVLLNPSAGRGRALREKDRLEDCLRSNEVYYDLFVSESEEHLRLLAATETEYYPVIIGVGGDSTFNMIANEIIKAKTENIFGMIGLGSSDDIVREFGVDSLEAACSAIKDCRTRKMDVGCLIFDKETEPLYFLGTASLGLGVTVNRFVAEFTQNHPYLSKSQLIDGILGTYCSYSHREVPRTIRLGYDGKSEHPEFSLIVFNNTNYYASGLRPSPSANPFDGILNVCIANSSSFFNTLLSYCSMLRQKHTSRKNIKMLEAKEFRISSDEGIEIQVDGEIKGPYREIKLYVKPCALEVISKRL